MPIWQKILPYFFGTLLWGQIQVLTANYGNERTNANLSETILTTANVNPAHFGKVGEYLVDGQIYAQPLYVTGAAIPGQGIRNVVYVATMHNSVYAFDADPFCSRAPLWQVNVGSSLPNTAIAFSEINPEIGTLSTPTIDLGTNTLYVVAETYELGAPIFRLHALDLGDGSEKFGGRVTIQATVDGGGDDTQNGKIGLDPTQHPAASGSLTRKQYNLHRIRVDSGSLSLSRMDSRVRCQHAETDRSL
jgi:hypothetical protein